MSFFSSSPATQTTTSSSLSTSQPSAYWLGAWGDITGAASGLASYPINNYYTGQRVADPSQLSQEYWDQAGKYGYMTPTVQPAQGTLQQLSGAAYNLQQNPGAISITPDQGTLQGIANWGKGLFSQTPQVQAPGGVSGLASSYQVPYSQVSAPTVTAPTLRQYQMGPAQQTGTQTWTAPGTSAQYMSPYTQQVVNAQLAQAQVQEQQQLTANNAAAAQAGAFGGSRNAVENANTEIGYQQLAANLEAQGLQNAYQLGAQQFNTEQGLGLQSQMANQQAGLTVGAQNLASNLQTQGLGAQLNMQGQLANQSAQMQAGLANQSAGIQTGLAAQQLGLQGAVTNAQLGMQSQLANQAAIQQGLSSQYQGGVQAALQQQQLGMQGQISGEQLRQAQQQANLQDISAASGMQLSGAQLGLQGYQAGLQGQQALQQAALSQQGYQQSLNDAQLATYLQNIELPMQALGWQAGIQSLMTPLTPYYTTNQSTQNIVYTPAQQSILGQALVGGLGALAGSGQLASLLHI